VMSLHRVREGFKEERTACINRIRGVLAEHGLVFGKSPKVLRAVLTDVLEDAGNTMTGLARMVMQRAFDHWCELDEHMTWCDRQIGAHVRGSEDANRAAKITGIGEIGATLTHYLSTYNHLIPQRALKHQSPIQALQKWRSEKPKLFVKRVEKQPGLDSCRWSRVIFKFNHGRGLWACGRRRRRRSTQNVLAEVGEGSDAATKPLRTMRAASDATTPSSMAHQRLACAHQLANYRGLIPSFASVRCFALCPDV